MFSLSNIKIPLVGWTFAEDFFTSKTSHLSFAAITTAVTLFRTGHFSLFQTLLFCFLGLAAAFLRDAHSKVGEDLSWVIGELLTKEKFPNIDPAADGGEVDAPVAAQ